METVVNNGITHTTSRSAITLDSISASQYQKEGTLSAQIRQVMTTVSSYPSKKVENSLQNNPFSAADFGFEKQDYTSVENRMAWINVPFGIKQEDVVAKLAAASANGACIYRVLSNEPILSDDQKYAVEQGIRTKDDFAKSQAVRYPENQETLANGSANKLTLDKAGNVQYRRTFYWNTPMADVDARTADTSKHYLSAELEAELNGASVMVGQTI